MYPSVNDLEFPAKEKKSIREKSITIPFRNQLSNQMYFNKVHEHQVFLTWETSPVKWKQAILGCDFAQESFVEDACKPYIIRRMANSNVKHKLPKLLEKLQVDL